jgi:uncharacterized protein
MRALLLACVLALPAAAALVLPARPDHGRVLDAAGILTPGGKSQLQAISDDLEKKTGSELAVAVVKTLDGTDAADYANRLFRAWGVGKKGQDNGVLILLCPSERKARIEAGYGVEGVLPDALAGRILKDEVHPLFHDGHFEEGLLLGARRVSEILVAGAPASAVKGGTRPKSQGDMPLAVAVPFFSLFVLIGGGIMGAGIAAGGAQILFALIFGLMFSAIPMVMAWLALGGLGLGFGVIAAVWLAAFLYGLRHPLKPSTGGGGGSDGWSSGSSGSSSSSSSDSGSSGGSDFGGGSSGGGGASDSF